MSCAESLYAKRRGLARSSLPPHPTCSPQAPTLIAIQPSALPCPLHAGCACLQLFLPDAAKGDGLPHAVAELLRPERVLARGGMGGLAKGWILLSEVGGLFQADRGTTESPSWPRAIHYLCNSSLQQLGDSPTVLPALGSSISFPLMLPF